jgi:uncharacterized integral membrane protein
MVPDPGVRRLARGPDGDGSRMAFADGPAAPATDDDVVRTSPDESRRDRTRRLGHRAGLYLALVVLALLVLAIVLLALDNRQQAQLSWVVGDTRAAVVWIVLVSAIVGWLAGIVTTVAIRRRTRAPR